MLVSLTLAPLVKTQLKSEFPPILLRVNGLVWFCSIEYAGDMRLVTANSYPTMGYRKHVFQLNKDYIYFK